MPTLPAAQSFLPVALAAGFALAHTQSPLFFSNQNQYLLHGLANAGYGHLANDWLANTRDPTPLFSLGVTIAYRVAGLWPLQVAYFILLMGYFLAVWRLVAAFRPVPLRPAQTLVFAALWIAGKS